MLGRVLKVLQLFVLTVFLFFSALKVKQMTNKKPFDLHILSTVSTTTTLWYSNCFDDQETPLDFLFCSFF